MGAARRPRERRVPAYDIKSVHEGFSTGSFVTTLRVRGYLRRKGWDRRDVQTCVTGLHPQDFYKSQEHLERPGVWLDIYRPRCSDEHMYVKFVFDDHSGVFVLLTFCVDGEQH